MNPGDFCGTILDIGESGVFEIKGHDGDSADF
jgi:hypothetical protein